MAKSEQERLAGPISPLPLFPQGTTVKVFMGAGWAKGTVSTSDKDACSVYLSQLRKHTRVKDARNILRTTS